MTTDRELLELAAKAAVLELAYCESWGCMARELSDSYGRYYDNTTCWNPIKNPSDTLALEVSLRFATAWDPESEKWVIGELLRSGKMNWLASHSDRQRATTMAAAEYGKILSR
jgi:hypothetical protein